MMSWCLQGKVHRTNTQKLSVWVTLPAQMFRERNFWTRSVHILKYAPSLRPWMGRRRWGKRSPTRFQRSSLALTDPLLIQHNTTNVAASSYGGSGCRWANSIIKPGGQKGGFQLNRAHQGEWFRFGKWMWNKHCAAAGGDWLFTHNNSECGEEHNWWINRQHGMDFTHRIPHWHFSFFLFCFCFFLSLSDVKEISAPRLISLNSFLPQIRSDLLYFAENSWRKAIK